jgi:hypothetical protein
MNGYHCNAEHKKSRFVLVWLAIPQINQKRALIALVYGLALPLLKFT